MAKAYVVNQVEVHDAVRYAEYAALGRRRDGTQHGGRILAARRQGRDARGRTDPATRRHHRVPDLATPRWPTTSRRGIRPPGRCRGDAATVRFALVDGVPTGLTELRSRAPRRRRRARPLPVTKLARPLARNTDHVGELLGAADPTHRDRRDVLAAHLVGRHGPRARRAPARTDRAPGCRTGR